MDPDLRAHYRELYTFHTAQGNPHLRQTPATGPAPLRERTVKGAGHYAR